MSTFSVKQPHSESSRSNSLERLQYCNIADFAFCVSTPEGRSLLTVGDNTGIVYEVVYDEDEGEISLNMAPKHVIAARDGLQDKAMKAEWATVKDGKMVVGSIGREYTTSTDGEIFNMWVAFIDENGDISREDWTEQYT